MNVHVSVHDVSPAWATEVEMAVTLARRHGVNPALLVVPDFHGAWPLLAHPSFCRRLRELSLGGCETYLHGFLHRSRPGVAKNFSARVRRHVAQTWISDREAEFSDLTETEASFRLDQGERVLDRADLTIAGFVPPAWSMPSWLVPMLAARSYRFAEDHTRIYDPQGGLSRRSLVLNYATRTPTRLAGTWAYCRAASHAARFFPTRIAIHPSDLHHRTVRDELDRLLSRFEGHFVEKASDLFGHV